MLVIDDEKNIRATLSLCLEQIGCQVTAVSSDKNALDALTQQAYDLAFLDVRLGEASGLDLIPKLIADCPNLLVVVITAYATIDNAVEAIKRGAADYLAKPFTPAQIRHVVDQCMRQRDLKRQVTDLEGRLREAAPETDLESDSPNSAWQVGAFRAYADFMLTPGFDAIMAELEPIAEQQRIVLMCAEAVPWQCHRQLLADAFLVRGWNVLHIMEKGCRPHALPPFAKVDGQQIVYSGLL